MRGLAAAWVLAVRRGPWRAPAARVGVSVGGWSRRPRGLPAVRALHGWLEIRSGAQGNRSEASQGDQELPGPWPVTWQVQQAPAGRAREPAGQAEQAASEGFQGIAFFEGATFQGEAGFSAATFQDLARFRKATFQGIVLFNQASFQGDAVFAKAAFQRGGGFLWTTFQRGASFEEVAFQGGAFFSYATFGGAWFTKAVFQDVASFEEVAFQGAAKFDGATFGSDTGVEGVAGAQVLHLDDPDLNTDLRRVWPNGCTVRPDPADPSRGTLVYAEHVEEPESTIPSSEPPADEALGD